MSPKSGLLVIVMTEPETKHNYDAEQSCLRLGFLSRGMHAPVSSALLTCSSLSCAFSGF